MGEDVMETKRTTIVQQPTVSIARKEYKDGASSWNFDVTAPLDADWASLVTRIAEMRIHASVEDARIQKAIHPEKKEDYLR